MTEQLTLKPSILVDWLQFTLLEDNGLTTVLNILRQPLQDYQQLDKGGLGYKRQLINNNIRLYFDGLAGMGVCASISGSACRYLESRGVNLWQLIYNLNKSTKINITRLDLALDTADKLLLKVKDSLDKGLYISKSRSFKYITNIVGSVPRVETIYIGSRQSDVSIRIYDKAVEQKLEDVVWERWEIVFKKRKIKQVINLLEQDINSTFKGILYNYFRPVTKIVTNKSRSPIAPWYTKFIGAVDKITIYTKPKQKTIEDKYAWINNQVAPTLSLLSLAFGSTQFLDALVQQNIHRIRDKDFDLIYNFKGAQK